MERFKVLSNNVLKIIACISMLIDHAVIFFCPDKMWIRAFGRIAYPLFAFCLVEGCFYTKNKVKHFALIALLGCLMLVGEYVFADITDFNIFISFALSIMMIYLIDDIDRSIRLKKIAITIISIAVLAIMIVGLNVFIYYFHNFDNNYGYFGIMVPPLLYVVKKYMNESKLCIWIQVLILAILIVIRAFTRNVMLILFALVSIPLILMYNGKRGKWKMKYFFYIFYPLHFIILYLISLLIG